MPSEVSNACAVLSSAGASWIQSFRGDEQFLPGDAALRDRVAHGFLVAVRGGGIDQPVAGLERVADGCLGLFRADLEDAEAEDRHVDAVVEGDGFHGMVLSIGLNEVTDRSGRVRARRVLGR